MSSTLRKIAKTSYVRFKTQSGQPVPGVTTVINLLAKPQLIVWANRLGLQGIDSTKYRDEAADIGKLAHAMIQADLLHYELDYDGFSDEQIKLASNTILSFDEWKKHRNIEPLFCESSLISEKHLFGGIIDCYCKIDGEHTLIDFKTGKAIYDEYFVQLAAYKELLIENGFTVDKCRIIRVGRDEKEGFEDRVVSTTDKYFGIFESLLNVYNLKKALNWT